MVLAQHYFKGDEMRPLLASCFSPKGQMYLSEVAENLQVHVPTYAYTYEGM